MDRKKFFVDLSTLTVSVALLGNKAFAQTAAKDEQPPFPVDLVKEFVIAGHGNFQKVQDMLKEHPNLIYSKFDWGNGDFEAAIEGAGHVGNKDIANYLLEAGSRVTLYVLTMLGKTELVRPVLEYYPSLITAK